MIFEKSKFYTNKKSDPGRNRSLIKFELKIGKVRILNYRMFISNYLITLVALLP